MVNWVIDELLNERQYDTGFPTLAEAAEELGHKVFKTKYVPFSHELKDFIPLGSGSCVVTHGTIQFCRQVEREHGRYWTPGLYFNQNVKSFSRYSHHLGKDLLNHDYYILPFGEVKHQVNDNCFHWFGKSVFIKPNSGMKEFVGQVIHADSFEQDIKILHGAVADSIDDDCLCVLAQPRNIKAEFRYLIADKQMITGSEYRWDNVLDVRQDTHPLCDELAWKIAKSDWQADTVYICDVALLDDWWLRGETAKVVELNAFSSSGLYAMDTRKIVKAVSEAAERENRGDVL